MNKRLTLKEWRRRLKAQRRRLKSYKSNFSSFDQKRQIMNNKLPKFKDEMLYLLHILV